MFYIFIKRNFSVNRKFLLLNLLEVFFKKKIKVMLREVKNHFIIDAIITIYC